MPVLFHLHLAYNRYGFMNKKISLVIPVYNEEMQLAACLRTVARQKRMPDEVIVVDNNSTDRTAQIARRFRFVKVITAKRQGVVYARDRGFNAAHGDIIGRIDADTRLPRDWTLQVARIFEDDSIDAASGAMNYYDVPYSRFFSRFDLAIRRHTARLMADEVFLQGANMAVRRSAWRACRNDMCRKCGLHEDFDLAIHLSQAGRRVVFDETLQASITARCIDDSVVEFWSYVLLSPGTYKHHDLKSRKYMYVAAGLALLFHLPLRTLYRTYNDTSDYRRVNPATYVE
jgi:glycosyltransferase involved in cell wall biosynthesis